jgi:alpha-beta hydrolase superfamily lysophospholipase
MIIVYILLGILIVIILVMIMISFIPFKLKRGFTPNPAKNYAEALDRITAIRAQEAGLDLHPLCVTRAYTHGERVKNAIIFLHGFTACPDQFDQLAKLYFEQGYNVYIPRLPRHGDKDPLGKSLQGLTAEELAETATQSADIAQGLGERVVVCGLSGGGTMTLWLSQNRSDIALAVPIAPFLGVSMLPPFVNRALGHLPRLIPDFFVWWDPVNKVNNPFAAPYSDTRFPVHAALEILRLALSAQAQARTTRPAAGAIILISNANDTTVSNKAIARFMKIWATHGENLASSFQFNKSLGLPHDLIRPERSDARVDLVYPKLMELVK